MVHCTPCFYIMEFASFRRVKNNLRCWYWYCHRYYKISHWRKNALSSVDNSTKKCSEFRQLPQVLIQSLSFAKELKEHEGIWKNCFWRTLAGRCRTDLRNVAFGFAVAFWGKAYSWLLTRDSWLMSQTDLNLVLSCLFIIIYIYIFTYIIVYYIFNVYM